MQYKISKIQLTNFRNLGNDLIVLSDNINCIFGDNGNGKTNLLEAIHFLIHKKSFRKNTAFPQIISVECEEPEILFNSLIINTEEDEKLTFSGKVLPESSQWFLNNQPTKKKLPLETVFINPFDSYGFHTTPSFRRNWFDQHISKISPEYKRSLSKFNQALRFRNNLLSKKPAHYEQQIQANDGQLAQYSFEVIQGRKNFIAELQGYCEITFKLIFDEAHKLDIELESKFKSCSVRNIHDYYTESLQKDEIIGHTRTGVHRDDYVFHLDGFNSYEYASLGQQKMSFLSLIFAYIELFRYKYTSYPIVLIDDVSGELDSRRWKNLIEYLEAKNFQVLITTANESFREHLESIAGSNKLFIDNGDIKIL